MPKNTWFGLAWTWTVIVAVLCLVRLTNLPKVGIESADKYVHTILHFVFVLLWSQHYRQSTRLSEMRLMGKSFLYSIVFGCLIEVAQEYLTTARQADFKDVMANFTGAALAVLIQLALIPILKRNTE